MIVITILCISCWRDRPDDGMPCECNGGPNRHDKAMEAMRESGRKLRREYDQR